MKNEIAQKFLDNNLNVIPLLKNKRPAVEWDVFKTNMNVAEGFDNSPCIGVVCGGISGGLEVIDVDAKYDLSNTLYSSLKEQIGEPLCSNLVHAATKNNGYHLIYRCEKPSGNKKIAKRYTTEEEKKEVYDKSREKGKSHAESLKAKENHKELVLLESRGEGGYIVSAPSEGYKIIHGKLSEIPHITDEEREHIWNVASAFNEVAEEKPVVRVKDRRMNTMDNPSWDDYNHRTDLQGLLEGYGWTLVRQRGKRKYMRRSGSTSADTSGHVYDNGSIELFKCWTSSTVLEPEKAYTAFQVYSYYEHNGDMSEAARRLYSDGYGDRVQNSNELTSYNTERKMMDRAKESVEIKDDVSEYLEDYDELRDKVQAYRDGIVQESWGTGVPYFDNYFKFRRSVFRFNVAHSSIGKTTFEIWLMVVGSLLHDFIWSVLLFENSGDEVYEMACEFYTGKNIKEMSDEEFKEAGDWVKRHFIIVKALGGEISEFQQALDFSYKLIEDLQNKGEEIPMAIFIDPYSALQKKYINGENDHSYDNRILTNGLNFCAKSGVGIILSTHTLTSARRNRDENGKVPAPLLAHADGGGKFENRVDIGMVYHRDKDAEAPLYRRMLVRVAKNRNRRVGKVTPIDKEVMFEMNDNNAGYTCINMGSVIDPIANYWASKRINPSEDMDYEGSF